jgi:hypothetical protein
MPVRPSKIFISSGKRGCFKVSLFHAATILMLVVFDGFTLSPRYETKSLQIG